MTLSAIEVNHLKQAPAMQGVLPVIHHRWSPRAYADRPVAAADLARVFEAARWAASSSNEQPWRYVVGLRGSATYDKIFQSLVEFNQNWAASAPVLILGTARAHTSRSGRPNGYALYDLGQATAYLALQATALGLAAHQMGGYNQQTVRAALGIPEEYLLGSVMTLGYQGEPDTLKDEGLRTSELQPRERKPLSEIVFSAWDVPANLD